MLCTTVDCPTRLVLVTLDVITLRLPVTRVCPAFPEVASVVMNMLDVVTGGVLLLGIEGVVILPEEGAPQETVCVCVDPLEEAEGVDVVTSVVVVV